MKAGKHVRLPDGREGTVVYNGLDGVGIKWGLHDVTAEQIGGNGNLWNNIPPRDFEWFPDAMLRKPYKVATYMNEDGIEYVGDDFEVIE